MNETTNTTEPQIAYSECYVQPFFSFYNADNMAIMRTFKDKEFDLAIVDPPYGIGAGGKTYGKRRKKHDIKDWDNETPTDEYFAELFRISKKQIIWGGNYFDLPLTNGWVVWDKDRGKETTFSDGELAWTSFLNLLKILKVKYDGFLGMDKDGRIHPTQKPVQLYERIVNNYANENDKIIDTHLGSGSIAIAIDKANTLDKKNLTFVGIELDPDYFRAAVERFKNYKRQCVLF